MAWKLKYRCKTCGYEAEVYEGRDGEELKLVVACGYGETNGVQPCFLLNDFGRSQNIFG